MVVSRSSVARLDPPFTEADWERAGCPKAPPLSSPYLDPPFDWGSILDDKGEILSPEDFRLLDTWWGGEVYFGGTYLGLNAMRCYRYEASVALATPRMSRKFGSLPAILQDTHEIGAQFLRQPDLADTLWPAETYNVPSQAYDIDLAFTATAYSPIPALAALLMGAATKNQKVVITFLSAGSGQYVWQVRKGASPWPTTEPPDPKEELFSGPVWLPLDATQHSAATPDPVNGAGLYDLDFEGNTDSFLPGDGAVDAWVYSSLDPRSPYKLGYVELIAKHQFRLARGAYVRAFLGPNHRLDELVGGRGRSGRFRQLRGGDDLPLCSRLHPEHVHWGAPLWVSGEWGPS